MTPRIERVERTEGGRLRVAAVRSEVMTRREEWRFLVSPAGLEVEALIIRTRAHNREPWREETHSANTWRLSAEDRRELKMLAGQALAREIRAVRWLGEDFTQ